MVNLEAKIGFMLLKFKDLIIKAAIELVKKRHQSKCSFGSSMELNARVIEKEPSKLESVNIGKTSNEDKTSYNKNISLKNFNNIYSSETSKTEVLVSCCCGQNFRLNNKDKEFQNELSRVQAVSKNYEAKQQSSQEYTIDKKDKMYK